MPSVLPATMRAEDLPEIATIAEVAAYERVDARTLRKACDAGTVPGAFRRGRPWRINTRAYLAAIGGAG